MGTSVSGFIMPSGAPFLCVAESSDLFRPPFGRPAVCDVVTVEEANDAAGFETKQQTVLAFGRLLNWPSYCAILMA